MACPLYTEYKKKIRPYIDLIDSLRELGLDNELALPTIAVIGDQSSGKSSVLEMLSEVALPRGTGIVTRCPLELKLKNGEKGTPWKGLLCCRDTLVTLKNPDKLEEEIKTAQEKLAGKTGISSELISLQVESSCVPELTLIDLPGIIRVPVGDQPQDIGAKIKNLIKSYISKEETIILVVIACNVDIATTEALKMAQEVDPKGERTLGVLTKPDLIDRGTERDLLKIINNQIVPLQKGYMLIKCRGQQDLIANTSLANALENETKFFEQNVHYRPLLERKMASCHHLSARLTNELVVHIKKCLPDIQEKIRMKISKITKQLDKMGSAEDTKTKVHNLTSKILVYCEELMNLAMGDYKKDFSDDVKLHDFARGKFTEWYQKLNEVKMKYNEEAIKIVEHHEKYSKGRELPGFTKYRVFEAIIRDQIQELLEPSLQMMKEFSDKVETVFNMLAIQHFSGFPVLINEVKIKIAETCQKMENQAEHMIIMNFNMEEMVYAPDAMYSYKLIEVQSLPPKKGSNSTLSSNPDVQSMVVHLQIYYQIAIDRLIQMVPMVLRYFLLQELSVQTKLELTQLLFQSPDMDALLHEADDVAEKRRALKDSLDRLTNARNLLRKVAHNKRERTGTGGGPANLQPLTPLEERVAALTGPAWRKVTSTAQAWPTLEREELKANPDDAEEDSDMDKPEEENIFQSNPPDQHGGEREGMELDEARSVVLTLEEVPLMEVTAPSVISGLSVGGTFHSFLLSEAAGPSGGVRATPQALLSEAAGPSGGVQATPRALLSEAAGPSGGVQATPRALLSEAAGPSGGVRATPRALSSEAAGPSGGVRATPRTLSSEAAGPSDGVRATPRTLSSEAAGPSGGVRATPRALLSEAAGPSGGVRGTPRTLLSEAAGPSGGVRGTPRTLLSEAAGPSGGVRATPRALLSEAAGPSGGVRATSRALLSEAAGPSGGVQATPRALMSEAAGPSGGVRATPVGRRGWRARPYFLRCSI
uniref:interferon-induced GTP-binding protein Mx3-like isoform X2 n=1 Tax=Pristiophorus japonicus TaxID=55135 RepID=UPI00398F7EE9